MNPAGVTLAGRTPDRGWPAAGLAAFQAFDTMANLRPNPWLELERLRIPGKYRRWFPAVKGLSVAGLALGLVDPRVGRYTTRALLAYFTLAIASHARVGDGAGRYVPAVAMLALVLAAQRQYCRMPSATAAPAPIIPIADALLMTRAGTSGRSRP